jgi:hypothetical protein
LQFGDGFVEGFLATGGDGNAGAAIEEDFGQGAAEAGGTAEDEGAFVLPVGHTFARRMPGSSATKQRRGYKF